MSFQPSSRVMFFCTAFRTMLFKIFSSNIRIIVNIFIASMKFD